MQGVVVRFKLEHSTFKIPISLSFFVCFFLFFIFCLGLINSTCKSSMGSGIWYSTSFFLYIREFALLLLWDHITNNSNIIFYLIVKLNFDNEIKFK